MEISAPEIRPVSMRQIFFELIRINIACEKTGQAVVSPSGTDKVANGKYLPNHSTLTALFPSKQVAHEVGPERL